MTEDQAKETLLKIDPIVAATPDVGLVEHARENMGVQLAPGVAVDYLRLSQAVAIEGWEHALQLGEIQRLLANTMAVPS